MQIFSRAFFVVLCAIFSAPIQAEDFVSLIEQNFPYQVVDESYGVTNVQAGRCREGVPFSISQKRFQTSTNMDIAKRIHEELRSLGANAFVITDLQEDTRVRSITLTPLTCVLR